MKTTQTVEKIEHLGQQVAIIVRSQHKINNLEFFTDDQNPLQVGIHQKKKGTTLTPHIHLSNTKVISEIQEVLYIIEGKVKVTYYTIDGDVIGTYVLAAGDSLIHFRMGHGFEILEDAKIFEVKQGPYPGTQHAKIYLKGEHV
jgi:cupin fold WbuC family metalloprotein